MIRGVWKVRAMPYAARVCGAPGGSGVPSSVMLPASGVDLSAPQLTIVYQGPDRVPVAGQTEVITDLVRTGDFEAVLSWVAGATERVPFRVITLSEPTRIAIDLATP